MGTTRSKPKEKLYYGGNIVKTSLDRVYSVTVSNKTGYYTSGCCFCDDFVYTNQKSMYLKEIYENEVNGSKVEHYFAKRGKQLVYLYSVDVKKEKEPVPYDRSRMRWVTNRINKRIISEHKDEFIVNENETFYQENIPFLQPNVLEPGEQVPVSSEGVAPSAPPFEGTVR